MCYLDSPVVVLVGTTINIRHTKKEVFIIQLPCLFMASGRRALCVHEEGERIVVYIPCLCCALTLPCSRPRVPVAKHILSGETLLFQEKGKVDPNRLAGCHWSSGDCSHMRNNSGLLICSALVPVLA